MDEPIGALDAKLREQMRIELKRLHLENNSTSIYVTHDQVEAMSLADRIVIMHDGVVQQVGDPSEVYAHPANLFVAQFIGSPVMNIAPVRVETSDGRVLARIYDAGFDMPEALTAQLEANSGGSADLALGVRPEGIELSHDDRPGYVPAEAHIIQPFGPFDIVDLRVGGHTLRARTESGFVPDAGTRVWARLDPAQTHFFDNGSGDSLGIRLG
jgi:multiple sugar transport system ATP-binding protein